MATGNQTLRQCHIFSALTPGEINMVAALASGKEYESGAIIFQEQDRTDELLILGDGKVALRMTCIIPPRRQVTVDIAIAGEVVDWASLVEPHVHNLTAICLRKSRLLALEASKLRALLRENSRTSAAIMMGVTRAVICRLNDTRQLLISERYWPQETG